MFENTYPEIFDVKLTINAPFEEIWFVQHMIESMDGLGLVSSGLSEEKKGTMHVLTTSDRITEIQTLIHELCSLIGNLEIIDAQNY